MLCGVSHRFTGHETLEVGQWDSCVDPNNLTKTKYECIRNLSHSVSCTTGTMTGIVDNDSLLHIPISVLRQDWTDGYIYRTAGHNVALATGATMVWGQLVLILGTLTSLQCTEYSGAVPPGKHIPGVARALRFQFLTSDRNIS
jgi:hypothetical protein